MNILTFDIEDWFHLLDHDSTKTESKWESFPARVEENTDRILELLTRHRLSATFFCLGWIAERHPRVVKRIDALGYEVATHSYAHQLAYEQSPKAFRDDLVRSIGALEDLTGKKVRAYRAPGFSATELTPWLFETLCELGIEIDCSVFPAERAHGGFSGFEARPAWIEINGTRLKEFPMNTARILSRELVFSGGGYFRLFPYSMIDRLMRRSDYVMTYFHPRDFDPDQPMIEDLPLTRKLKSYCGLSRALGKLERLIDDHEFVDLRTAESQVAWESAPVIDLGVAAPTQSSDTSSKRAGRHQRLAG